MKRTILLILTITPLAFVAGFLASFGLRDEQTTVSHVSATSERPYAPLSVDTVEQGINTERTKAGLPPLTTSPVLRASACAKADDMLAGDYWSHSAPNGTHWSEFIRATGYRFFSVGENLAYFHQSEAVMIGRWMDSPTHRDNILGSYQDHGVCVRYGTFQGRETNLTVHHFGQPL